MTVGGIDVGRRIPTVGERPMRSGGGGDEQQHVPSATAFKYRRSYLPSMALLQKIKEKLGFGSGPTEREKTDPEVTVERESEPEPESTDEPDESTEDEESAGDDPVAAETEAAASTDSLVDEGEPPDPSEEPSRRKPRGSPMRRSRSTTRRRARVTNRLRTTDQPVTSRSPPTRRRRRRPTRWSTRRGPPRTRPRRPSRLRPRGSPMKRSRSTTTTRRASASRNSRASGRPTRSDSLRSGSRPSTTLGGRRRRGGRRRGERRRETSRNVDRARQGVLTVSPTATVSSAPPNREACSDRYTPTGTGSRGRRGRPLAPEFRSSAGSPSTTRSRPTVAPATARAGSTTRPPAASRVGILRRRSGRAAHRLRGRGGRVGGEGPPATTDARVPASRRWRGNRRRGTGSRRLRRAVPLRCVRLALVRRRPRTGVVPGVGAQVPERSTTGPPRLQIGVFDRVAAWECPVSAGDDRATRHPPPSA